MRKTISAGSSEHGHREYTRLQRCCESVTTCHYWRPRCDLRGLEAGVYLPIGVCRRELIVGKVRDRQLDA